MTTPNIPLETVPANTLQPSVPVNDAMQVLDALVRPGGIVQSTTETAPPTTTSGDVGKRWIIGVSATGAWAGKDGQIALCTAAGLWRYFTPAEGWQAYSIADAADVRYDGEAWVAGGGSGDAGSAADVTYDNTASGLTAEDAQAAIDELAAEIAAIPAPGDSLLTITTKTADATLALSDGDWIRMNVATANTLTVPPDSAVDFPIGTAINVRQMGAGQTTIVAGAGVTLTTAETLKLRKQGAVAVLVKEAADSWALTGDTEALP